MNDKNVCLDKIYQKIKNATIELKGKSNFLQLYKYMPACMKNILKDNLEDNKVYKKNILIQKESSTDNFFCVFQQK